MDFCNEHEQAFLKIIEPHIGEMITGSSARDLAAKVELTIHTATTTEDKWDDATIRQSLRVLGKLGKLPSGFKVSTRGKVGDEAVALFLENRGVLEELSPEELARLVESSPSAEEK